MGLKELVWRSFFLEPVFLRVSSSGITRFCAPSSIKSMASTKLAFGSKCLTRQVEGALGIKTSIGAWSALDGEDKLSSLPR